MVHRCVVYGCGNVKDKEKQISLHPIPFYNDQNPEAVRRRKKWIAFVLKTRNKWTPSKHSKVCSAHFTADDFTHIRRLKRDDIGVCVIPTIHWPEKAKKAMTIVLNWRKRRGNCAISTCRSKISTKQRRESRKNRNEKVQCTCDKPLIVSILAWLQINTALVQWSFLTTCKLNVNFHIVLFR